MNSTDRTGTRHAPDDSLANRYGRTQRRPLTAEEQRRRRWNTGWLISAALVAAVAVTAWFSLSATSRMLAYKDVGFEIQSPTQASVTFQVTKEPEATVACGVQVLSENYAIVGWETVVIGPTDRAAITTPSDNTQYYQVDLRTDSLGTNGGLNECWYEETSTAASGPDTAPTPTGDLAGM